MSSKTHTQFYLLKMQVVFFNLYALYFSVSKAEKSGALFLLMGYRY